MMNKEPNLANNGGAEAEPDTPNSWVRKIGEIITGGPAGPRIELVDKEEPLTSEHDVVDIYSRDSGD